MEIFFLGTASGNPDKIRRSSSVLIEDNERVLLDCGEGCSQSITALDINKDSITSIFISHFHPDHSIGLFMLIQKWHIEKRTMPLNVFMAKERINKYTEMLDFFYLGKDKLSFEINYIPLESKSYEMKNFSINVFPNNHLTNGEKSESNSFLITGKNNKIIYSSDINSVKDLEPHCNEKIDKLILDFMHTDAGELIDFVKDREIGELYITHYQDSQLLDKFNSISSSVECPVHIVNDLDSIRV